MPTHDLTLWLHSHDDGSGLEQDAERRTRAVVWLTLGAMLVELAAGWLTGSMALLADGWHMGSHAAALGIAAWAYQFARRHRTDPHFSFEVNHCRLPGRDGSRAPMAAPMAAS